MKKSSAEGKPQRSLEDVFREGFEGAESVPSAKLWDNLDRELENKELRNFRKEVLWYRGVAAASLLFLLMTGFYFWKANSGVPSSASLATAQEKRNKAASKVVEKLDLESTAPSLSETEKLAINSKKINNLKSINAKDYVDKPIPEPLEATKRQLTEMSVAAKPIEVPSLNQALALSNTEEDLMPPAASQVHSSSVGLLAREVANKGSVESLKVTAAEISMLDSANYYRPASLLVLKNQKKEESVPVPLAEIEYPAVLPSKWGLTLAYVPQYAYSPIKMSETANPALANVTSQSQTYLQYQEALNEYYNSYSPAYSFNTSVKASYNINAKWQLESGLLYAKNVATTQHSYIIQSSQPGRAMSSGFTLIQTQSGFDYFSAGSIASVGVLSVARTQPYTTQYVYQQVGVPVRIGYRHSQNKVFTYASAGVNVNMLLENKIETDLNSIEALKYKFNDSNSPFKSWQLFSTASAGIGYDVTRNLSILVSPEVTYALTPFLNGDQYQTDSFQFGISIGTKLRLYK